MIHYNYSATGRAICGVPFVRSDRQYLSRRIDHVDCPQCLYFLAPHRHQRVDTPPLQPRNPTWSPMPHPPNSHARVKWYRRGRTIVASECAVLDAPDGSGDWLESYVVSVSELGQSKPSDETMKRVRHDFGCPDGEEDNHFDGITRCILLVVDPTRRVDCECKTNEVIVRRPDGYTFTVPRELAEVEPC